MEQRVKPNGLSLCFAQVVRLALTPGLLLPAAGLLAQTAPATPAFSAWQGCAALADDKEARLACFDRWAAQQASAPTAGDNALAPTPQRLEPGPPADTPPATIHITTAPTQDCRSRQYSELSRFWELEAGSDCGTFNIRGYRPISLSWIGSDGANQQPSSPAPAHTAATPQPYSANETRIQLSVRTKIAQGLLTPQPWLRDSLWFGYTQQSYWQLFTGALSRPFRSTDHEPEITYIYPTDAQLPGGWRLRYSGLSLVHQSNGQDLPLSRSWNRLILMAGMEKGSQFRLQGRVWQRQNESAEDDDNPAISDLVGRAEISGFWNINPDNTLSLTLRHSLTADANGSARLEWLRKLGGEDGTGTRSGLRLHTQLFTGYGDSLVDYNRRRTVLSIGLSLVDW